MGGAGALVAQPLGQGLPSSGPATLGESQHGAGRASPGQPRAPDGGSVSPSGIQLPEARAPGKAPQPFSGNLGAMFSAARMWTWYQGVTSHLLLVIFPPTIGTGIGRGPSFLSSLAAAAASEFHPSPRQRWGRGSATSELPLQGGDSEALRQFPPRLLLPRYPFTAQDHCPQTFPAGGLGLFWSHPPQMTWKELTLPRSPGHQAPMCLDQLFRLCGRGEHAEWSQL